MIPNIILIHLQDRFTRPFKRTLTMITKMFGNFWTNVVLVVNFWSFRDVHAAEREARGVTTQTYAKQLKEGPPINDACKSSCVL